MCHSSHRRGSDAHVRRWLTLTLVAVIAIAQVACTMGAQPKTTTWKNSTGAEGYQRLFWQAVKDKDWLQVESHLASNVTYLSSRGSKDKQQTVAYLRALELKDFSLGDVSITPQGSDAIVTYSLTLMAASGAQTRPMPDKLLRCLAVWQQQKSGWVVVAMAEISQE